MKIYENDSNLILEDVSDFDIEDILECGQCFHFLKIADHEYHICAKGRFLHIKQECGGVNKVIFYNTTISDYEEVWKDYFDMSTDYQHIKTMILSIDDRLETAIRAKAGIRILHQDFFETLISFIISQNKQIPHIKQLVHTLSLRYGTRVDGYDEYLFPDVDELNEVSVDELKECKVGFRAPYIRDAVSRVYNGDIKEDELKCMSVQDAREKLMTIHGVGEKVSNCVLLFGLGRMDVFPVDVWMKRIMEFMYFGKDTKKEVIESFACEKYGEYAGYAQQYLFHYGRENGIGK